MRADRTALDERRITSDQLAFHDYLQQQGVADSFATIGFCAGAHREIRVALEDSRVVGSILINPVVVEWTPEQVHDRERRQALLPLRRGLVERLRSKRALSIAGLGRATWALVETAWGVGAAADQSQLKPVRGAFDRFEDSNTSVLFLFSQNEPLYDQLRRLRVLATLDMWANVSVEQLATSDHHLRPLTVQEFVQTRIDQFLAELQARHSTRPPCLQGQIPRVGARSEQRRAG